MARARAANVSDARALRMCELAIARLAREPVAVRELALANVATWERAGSCDPWYARRWRELLALGPAEMGAVLMAGTDEGQALRANNPFAGLFGREERNAIQAARPEA